MERMVSFPTNTFKITFHFLDIKVKGSIKSSQAFVVIHIFINYIKRFYY